MDDGGSITPLLITILLILFADFAAVSETALASVSKVRMKTLADHGNQKAQQVLDALDNFDRTISTLLICTNIAHLAIASVAVSERPSSTHQLRGPPSPYFHSCRRTSCPVPC